MNKSELYQKWLTGHVTRKTLGIYVRYYDLDGALLSVFKIKHYLT